MHLIVLLLLSVLCLDTKAKDSVVIHAQQSMTVDRQKNEGWALGDPEALHKDRVLKGDRLHVLFQPETHQVSQVEVLGHTHLTSPDQSLQGDRGLYEVNTQYMWCIGMPAILKDPTYTLVTYGSMQVWDQTKYGIASGDALLTMTYHRLRADTMTIQQTLPSDPPPARIKQAEAFGHVLAISDDRPTTVNALNADAKPQISFARGDKALYEGQSQHITLWGTVSCQREGHYLQGTRAVIDPVHKTTIIWSQSEGLASEYQSSAETTYAGALIYPQKR